MGRLAPLAVAFVLVLGAARPASAAESYASANAALQTELAAELEALGAWCVKRQLFLARNACAETILTFDPDHAKARMWLRYKRAKDGSWTRKSPFKPPVNRKPQSLPEYATRRAAILNAIRPKVLAAIRNASPALDFQARAEAVATWRPLLGDDPDLLSLAGLELHEGVWRSADTVRSLRRQQGMREAAKAALAARPKIVKRATPAAARALELPWAEGRGTQRVSAFGTASPAQLEAVIRLVHATEAQMGAQFGGTFKTRDYFTLYILRGRSHYTTMIDQHPDVRGDRKLLRGLSGAYVGHGKFIDLMKTQQGTLDSCISVATAHLLAERFAEGRSEWMTGWIADGFALYNMTWLTGTHLSFTVDFGRYGQDPLFKSLFSSATDWMAEARKLMLSRDPATLRLVLGRKTGHLGPRDFLAGYAFVAWLHEARAPAEVNALLRLIAEGKDIDKAFAGSLKMTVEDAEARLKRWLRESASK